MKRHQSGFTLIEIAIVLVIIGLLLGGVLKGQELINSARVKNLASDFRNIPVFIYGYQDKFKALPGDDANANLHLGNAACTSIPGGTCQATTPAGAQGNGVIDSSWSSQLPTDESYLFWLHIRLAGLAPGSTDPSVAGNYLPTNASGGTIGVQSGTSCTAAGAPTASCTATFLTPIKDATGNALRGSYVICSTGILGKFVTQLDTQMDDGNTATGSMMAVPTGSGAATNATPTAGIDPAASYTVCMGA